MRGKMKRTMKRTITILIAFVLCFNGMLSLPVYAVSTSGIEYPVNPMITAFNNTLLISWINPSGLSKTELYSVDDYTDTLITDNLSTSAGEAIEYEASNLVNGVDYSYRIKFYYQSGATYSVLLSDRPFAGSSDGIKILGNGELTKKLTVKSNAFSKTAKEKIEGVGGKTEVI